MRNKLVTAILTVLTLLLLVPSKVLADTGDSGLPFYVSDVAEILSDGQRQDLESTAEKISSQYGCGVYIVTLDDYREYDSKSDMFSFAQDFYRSYQLGIGDSKSGILLLLSMADRDYSLVTYGSKAHYAFTDYGQRVIASEFLDDFRENEWYEGFSDYLSCCGDLLDRADRGEPLDVVYNEHSRMNSGLSLGVIIGVPLLISFFACEMMKRQMKPVSRQTGADEYIVPGGINLSLKRDVFLNRSVTRTLIRHEDRGSPGGSMGGTTVNSAGFSGHSGKF